MSRTFSTSEARGSTTDAYAAGLIDGEGYIHLRGKRRSFTACVDVGMSEKAAPILEALQREYGGTLRLDRTAMGNHAARWRWAMAGRAAEAMLRRLLPFLRLKAKQAELVLRAADLRDATVQDRQWWPATLTQTVAVISAEIKDLNRTGPAVDPVLPVGGQWLKPQTTILEPYGEKFSGTWPRSASMRSGTVTQRQALAPRTSVTGCSALLPTPMARTQGGTEVSGESRTGGPMLQEAEARLLPTPRANDGSRPSLRKSSPDFSATLGERVESLTMLPTPHGMAKEGQARRPGPSGNELGVAVRRSTGASTTPPSTDGKPSTGLRLNPSSSGLRLNPEFVEWMLGTPSCNECGRGWTDPKCAHSVSAFLPSGTESRSSSPDSLDELSSTTWPQDDGDNTD